MTQLSWFALSRPRKLPGIAEHLGRRIRSAAARGPAQAEIVTVGVRAFGRLLQACHSSLGLFVEHFLRTVDALLESRNRDFQVLSERKRKKERRRRRRR